MVHKVRSANEFMKIAEHQIFAAKQHMVVKLSQDAVEGIKKDSQGQLLPESKRTVGHFIVGVPFTPEDPQGSHIQEIERSTGAFHKAYARLGDKSYVRNLLKGNH